MSAERSGGPSSAVSTPEAPAAAPAAEPSAVEPAGATACPRCGAELAPGQEWCTMGGFAARTRIVPAQGWCLPFALAGLVALLAGAALAVWLVSLSDDATTSAATLTTAQAVAPARPHPDGHEDDERTHRDRDGSRADPDGDPGRDRRGGGAIPRRLPRLAGGHPGLLGYRGGGQEARRRARRRRIRARLPGRLPLQRPSATTRAIASRAG